MDLEVGGIVLCGGRSRRMGSPKAWLELEGEPLLVRTVRILRAAVGPIVVVAAAEQDLSILDAAGPIQVVRDEVAHQGPLQGIAQGLESLPESCAVAYISSCDAPLLRSEWIRYAVDRLGGSDIVIPRIADRCHPLAAVYRRSVCTTARRLLRSDERRPVSLCGEHPTVYVSAAEMRSVDSDLDSLVNVNTPLEFASVSARMARRPE